MIFDQNTSMVDGEVLAVPDWVFVNTPKQGEVQDTATITGSNTGTAVSITGTADNQGV